MIDTIFVKVLNMSFIASYAVLIIVLIRLLLKKSPKIYSYMLWGIVFLRMVCPFSFKSLVSWIPIDNNLIPQDIGYMQSPEIYSGMVSVDNMANNLINNNLAPVNEVASINPIQIVLYIGSIIWFTVIIIIFLYSILSYIRLYKNVRTATIVGENIYETDRIRTPFVLGFIKPRIYLPLGIKDKSYEYIISHEQTHIKRKDYIIKPLYFMAVVFHWFNPLMWLSYYLMTKDMEMSCDEKVMKLKGYDIKAYYAELLLNLSVKQSNLLNPIAFGENNTKSRIKNIIKYKKPRLWIVVITVIVIIISCTGLVTNPKDNKPDQSYLNIKNIAKVSAQTTELVARSGEEISEDVYNKGLDVVKNNRVPNAEINKVEDEIGKVEKHQNTKQDLKEKEELINEFTQKLKNIQNRKVMYGDFLDDEHYVYVVTDQIDEQQEKILIVYLNDGNVECLFEGGDLDGDDQPIKQINKLFINRLENSVNPNVCVFRKNEKYTKVEILEVNKKGEGIHQVGSCKRDNKTGEYIGKESYRDIIDFSFPCDYSNELL